MSKEKKREKKKISACSRLNLPNSRYIVVHFAGWGRGGEGRGGGRGREDVATENVAELATGTTEQKEKMHYSSEFPSVRSLGRWVATSLDCSLAAVLMTVCSLCFRFS